MDKLKEKLKDVPKGPGVYMFKSKDAQVIYIGKAKNLRSRLGQYFSGHDDRPQLPYLMAEAADFDYTVVNNELESLFLENTLIKQYLPKYNIMLRDDKNYAFIKIDYSTEIPQIGYARKIEQKSETRNTKYETNLKSKILNPKSVYFGPYTAAYKIRNTLHLMRKIFPYCSAQKVGSKPCFHYHLHRCPGVCIGKIPLEDYRLYLKKIEDFLAGNTAKIRKQLQTEMKQAAEKRQFEKAARLRDQITSLKLLEERQMVILAKKVDWDIVSLANDQGFACVNLFKVRGGKLQDKVNFVYEINVDKTRGHENYQQTEILQKFLEQYYLETSSVPKIIYIQSQILDQELIAKIIFSRFGRKAKTLMPQRGKAAELIRLGQTNAQEYLKNWLNDKAGNLDKINNALVGLKNTLNLASLPQRIECYDISNIQGTNAVGSMVVFEKGLPKKSQYRKFKIKTKQTPDDFAMMKEMLSRRLQRSVPIYGRPENADKSARYTGDWPLPDLIVIDGGKGQLSAALEVLTTYNLQLTTPIIGLAKRIEEIFIPGKSDAIILSNDDPALQLLQRLRDEAHRFGITFHRQLRSKQAVKSVLDDIPGIGPKTKKLLKAKFGSVANIRKSTLDELTAAVGKHLAQNIKSNI